MPKRHGLLALAILMLIMISRCADERRISPAPALPQPPQDASTRPAVDAGAPNACPQYPLSYLPIDSAHIRGIMPLGNVAPSDHIYPTTHTYIYLPVDESRHPLAQTVYAPGDMTITRIAKSDHYVSSTDHTIRYTDYRLDFSVCNDVTGYFILIYDLTSAVTDAVGSLTEGFDVGCNELASDTDPGLFCFKNIRQAAVIRAGTAIAKAGRSDVNQVFSLDFGLSDRRVARNGYIDNPTFNAGLQDLQHVVCPYEYYDPTSDAYGFAWNHLGASDGSFIRTDDGRCGKVDWEQPGTLSGIWLVPGKAVLPQNPHVSIMGYNVNPAYGIFMLGSEITNKVGIPVAGYLYARGEPTGGAELVNPDIDQVTADGRIACFDGLADQYDPARTKSFVIFAKLDDSTHATLEVVTGTSTCPALASRKLTGNAVSFTK